MTRDERHVLTGLVGLVAATVGTATLLGGVTLRHQHHHHLEDRPVVVWDGTDPAPAVDGTQRLDLTMPAPDPAACDDMGGHLNGNTCQDIDY
jgi:hypothetical protein